jgi:hypothetical protein
MLKLTKGEVYQKKKEVVLEIDNTPIKVSSTKSYSLYCLRDLDSHLARIFVETVESPREVYNIVTTLDRTESRIQEAIKVYGKKNISNCIYLKGKVTPISKKSVEVSQKFSLESSPSFENAWEKEKRNSIINNFYLLSKKHLENLDINIKIKKEYYVVIEFTSTTLAKGLHKIECNCLEDSYEYFHKDKLITTVKNIKKLFV